MDFNISEDKRYKFIDSIRGIAAILVVYEHIPWTYGAFSTAVGRFIDYGHLGVVLFFSVSGFVIPFSLASQPSSPKRRFLISRIFRLYPVYWLSILLAVFVVFACGGSTGFSELPSGNEITGSLLIANATMFQQLFRINNVIGVYWTLEIEIIFYIICVVIFWLGKLGNPTVLFRVAIGMVMVSLLMAVARYELNRALPVALTLGLGFMFWGSLWRRHLLLKEVVSYRYSLIFLGLFTITMPIISLLAYNRIYGDFNEVWYRYTFTYYLAAACFVIFTSKIRLDHGLFQWLGRISYSVYLLHSLVIALWLYFAHKWITSIPGLIQGSILFAVTLGSSQFSYVLLEKPGLRLGKILNQRIDLRAKNRLRKKQKHMLRVDWAGKDVWRVRTSDLSHQEEKTDRLGKQPQQTVQSSANVPNGLGS